MSKWLGVRDAREMAGETLRCYEADTGIDTAGKPQGIGYEEDMPVYA